jgi:hypothetical protein
MLKPSIQTARTSIQPNTMGSLKRDPLNPSPQLQTTDPSSAPAPPIPLDPKSDSDSDAPTTMIVGDEYTYDGISWHIWDRSAVSYAPPRPEDLPCPPTSLVDPHRSIRAARASIGGTRRNPQFENTRPYPIRPATAAGASRTVSASAFVADSCVDQPSAPAIASPASSGHTTSSSTLSSRDLQLQIEHYAAQLQAASRPEDQKAIIEEIMLDEAPTPQAVRVYYRRIAARYIERERMRDERWNSERGREGMLFGSELVGEAGEQDGDISERERGRAETEAD